MVVIKNLQKYLLRNLSVNEETAFNSEKLHEMVDLLFCIDFVESQTKGIMTGVNSWVMLKFSSQVFKFFGKAIELIQDRAFEKMREIR